MTGSLERLPVAAGALAECPYWDAAAAGLYWVDIPAGRVQPNEYATFQRFTQDADALVEREIALGK